MKRIFLKTGGVLAFLFLILALPLSTWAAEGECHLEWCFVPAPTILMPEQGEAVKTARPAIRALTWKTTIVKVYLDGVEMTNVQQRKHEDYYGSVFAVPESDLAEGEHYVYTMAYSEKPGWYDQSKESIYIYFTVKAPPSRQLALPTVWPKRLEPKEAAASQAKAESEVEIDIVPPAGQVEVEVKEGKIEGGVSVTAEGDFPELTKEKIKEAETPLQEAATFEELGKTLEDEFVERDAEESRRRNRIIGLSMLGVIIVILIVWTVASRQGIRREFKKEEKGDLPPPPQPPEGKKKIQKPESKEELEEIRVEPIKEEGLPSEVEAAKKKHDYWASPPPSPYSPYPPAIESDESRKEEEQNNLGI